MFRILSPLPPIDARARRGVYSEHVERHSDLSAVSVGCHNDMIMLETEAESGAAVAVLLATGAPGQRVAFPRHWHSKGEETICLDGVYGEWLSLDEDPDGLFEGSTSLAEFQRLHPGVVELQAPEGARVAVHLHPGARWSMGDATEHAPFGFVGDRGILLGQIYWGGPNKVLEAGA